MSPEPPMASGPKNRSARSPWTEPETGEWIATDLGEGRTLWRPPAGVTDRKAES